MEDPKKPAVELDDAALDGAVGGVGPSARSPAGVAAGEQKNEGASFFDEADALFGKRD